MTDWDAGLVHLYETRYRDLVRLAYLLTGSAEAAEELVQDAFVAARASWTAVREPYPYLRTVVVNRARSWGRRRQLEHRQPRPSERAVGLDADELWDALATLSPRQRAAIVLRFYEDLPDGEIAQALGCRKATVRTAVHRGLAALRQEIER
ncbi:MAG TPA: sigma-70 family RNA polymerase sigma factor [Acidimicrobiales bacterium]|nr:sigma-70 family RNA polymerase sigma factor [Acidimicrobiales bacterium]